MARCSEDMHSEAKKFLWNLSPFWPHLKKGLSPLFFCSFLSSLAGNLCILKLCYGSLWLSYSLSDRTECLSISPSAAPSHSLPGVSARKCFPPALTTPLVPRLGCSRRQEGEESLPAKAGGGWGMAQASQSDCSFPSLQDLPFSGHGPGWFSVLGQPNFFWVRAFREQSSLWKELNRHAVCLRWLGGFWEELGYVWQLHFP